MSNLIIRAFFLAMGYTLAFLGSYAAYPGHASNPLLPVYVLQAQGLDAPITALAGWCLACVIGLFALLPYGRKKTRYGFAAFGDAETRTKAKLDGKKGVLLGELALPPAHLVNNQDKRLAAINQAKRTGKKLMLDETLTVLVFAPPGTGKTASFLIPAVLLSENSLVIHDPKGEIYDLTAPTRASKGRVLRFNPMADHSAVFNPLTKESLPKDRRDWRGFLENMAYILIPDDQKGDSFFTANARLVFIYLASYLLATRGETSLPEVARTISRTPDFKGYVSQLNSELEDLPQDFFIETALADGNKVLNMALSENTWGSIISTINPKLSIFEDPRIAAATQGKNDITPDELREGIASLYLVVPDKDRQKLSPIMNMVIQTIAKALISEMPAQYKKRTGREPNAVTFMIDEFPRLGKMDELFNLPAISRGYRVNSVFIAQDFGQISALYGNQAADVFKNTCAYQIVFPQNQAQGAKDVAAAIGAETETKVSQSINEKTFLTPNKSLSEAAKELISAQTIMNMDTGRAILLAERNFARPMVMHMLFVHGEKELQDIITRNEPLRVVLPS